MEEGKTNEEDELLGSSSSAMTNKMGDVADKVLEDEEMLLLSSPSHDDFPGEKGPQQSTTEHQKHSADISVRVSAAENELEVVEDLTSTGKSGENDRETIDDSDSDVNSVQENMVVSDDLGSEDNPDQEIVTSDGDSIGEVLESSSVVEVEDSVLEIGSSILEEVDESELGLLEQDDSGLEGKINIYYTCGALLVWNAEDAQMLREECRIIGKLTGCLPRAPRQNNHLGLPLQLLPEEAKLLVDIDAAVIVEEESIPAKTRRARENAFNTVREENYKIQQQLFKESRKKEVEHLMGQIIAGKKAKKRKLEDKKVEDYGVTVSAEVETNPHPLEKNPEGDLMGSDTVHERKGEQGAGRLAGEGSGVVSSTSSGVEGSGRQGTSEPEVCSTSEKQSEGRVQGGKVDKKFENSDSVPSEIKSRDNTDESPKMDDEHFASENSQRKDGKDGSSCEEESMRIKEKEEDVDNLTAEDIVTTETSVKHSLVQIFTENPWKRGVKPCLRWDFPVTEREAIRYTIFKDLWKKGYYLTSGTKFGGDFLVYPGDPCRYHSHFIAVCLDQCEEMSVLDLVSMGRLASNTRKTTILCSITRRGKVAYTSLQWTGIS